MKKMEKNGKKWKKMEKNGKNGKKWKKWKQMETNIQMETIGNIILCDSYDVCLLRIAVTKLNPYLKKN